MRRTPGENSVSFDVQFDVGGKLSVMTLRTQIIGPRNARRSEHGENRLGAESLILRMVTTGARQLALLSTGAWYSSNSLRPAAPA